MAELKSITGGKKDPCIYCGKPAHPTPLSCPRISAIHVCPENAVVIGIEFWGDHFDDEETDPPEAA